MIIFRDNWTIFVYIYIHISDSACKSSKSSVAPPGHRCGTPNPTMLTARRPETWAPWAFTVEMLGKSTCYDRYMLHITCIYHELYKLYIYVVLELCIYSYTRYRCMYHFIMFLRSMFFGVDEVECVDLVGAWYVKWDTERMRSCHLDGVAYLCFGWVLGWLVMLFLTLQSRVDVGIVGLSMLISQIMQFWKTTHWEDILWWSAYKTLKHLLRTEESVSRLKWMA